MDNTAQPRPKPRHFSMMREFRVADFFTLGNAACGVIAIFFAMRYMASEDGQDLLLACAMAPIAFAFDVLDGMIARRRGEHSILGRELDSLADVISFGVAPATAGFAAGLQGVGDWIVLSYFICCGVSRLARFNVTAETLSEGQDKVRYFEGTPIPTSVVLTAVIAVLAWTESVNDALPGGVWTLGPLELHPLVLLFALSGSLMISKTLHVPKP